MAKVTGSAGLQDKHLSSERLRVKRPAPDAPRHSLGLGAGRNTLTRFLATGDDA